MAGGLPVGIQEMTAGMAPTALATAMFLVRSAGLDGAAGLGVMRGAANG